MDLPHNEEAESTLVGRLLVEPKQIALVASQLRPEHFYSADPREMYAAMLALTHEHKVVDLMSVQERVGRPLLSPGFGRLHHGGLEAYAGIIRRDWLRREAISRLQRTIRVAQEETSEESLLDSLSQAVAALSTGAETSGLSSPSDAVDSYLATLAGRKSGERGGLTWGLRELDERLLPAQPGNLIIIGARPSIGKTALVEYIADHWASQDRGPILFVSLEMKQDELMDRSIARRAKLDTNSIIRGTLTTEQWRLAEASAEALRSVGVWYYDRGSTTTGRVRAEAARVQMLSEGRLGGIIVDYLSLLKDKSGGDSEVTRVTRISGQLKALAQDFGVPVLVPSQLNRKAEYRKDQHPNLYDMRESGAIEQDADVVLGLYRETKKSKRMDISILKSRQGGGADTIVPIRFEGDTMTFSSWSDQPAQTGFGTLALAAAMASNPVEDPQEWD